MDQARRLSHRPVPFGRAPLRASMIRRQPAVRRLPAPVSQCRALVVVAPDRRREDARLFLYTYVGSLIMFLTWLA